MTDLTLPRPLLPGDAAVPPRIRVVPRVSMRGWKLWIFIGLVSAFILQYQTYLIHSVLWDRVIKLQALFLLAVCFRYYLPPRRVLFTILLFVLLFGTALAGAASKTDVQGVVQLAKFVLQWMIFPLVLFRFRPGEPLPRRFVHFLVFWGALFAVQAAILSALFFLEIPVSVQVINLIRYHDMPENSFGPLGILGYSNAFSSYDNFYLIRPQSWFIEPSTLAAFLLYPLIMAVAFYRAGRAKFWLLIALAVAAGLLSTFSLAGYIATTAAAVVLLLIRPGQTRAKRIWSVVVVILLPLLMLAIASTILEKMHDLYREKSATGQWTPLTRALARDPEHRDNRSLVRDAFSVKWTVQTALENPLGVGLGGTLGENENASPNAVLFWLSVGGLPGLFIALALQAQLFFAYALPLLRNRSPVMRGAAGAYIAATVHGLSYGTWVNAGYLVVVAIMILLADTTIRVQQRRRIAAQAR